MSEVRLSGLVDPELLPSQLAIRALSGQLLVGVSLQETEHVMAGVDPAGIRRLLEEGPLNDMLLSPGEPLAPDPDRYPWPADGPEPLVPGEDAVLDGISISTWSRHLVKARFMSPDLAGHFEAAPFSDDTPIVTDLGDRIRVKWPKEIDWIGNVALRLWYRRGEDRAAEVLRLVTEFREPGRLPDLAAEVAMIPAGLEHFSTIPRQQRQVASDAEASVLLSVIAALNAQRTSEA